MLQKQVQTLPVDHSNNSKTEDKIILLIISIWNISFNKIQPETSVNFTGLFSLHVETFRNKYYNWWKENSQKNKSVFKNT